MGSVSTLATSVPTSGDSIFTFTSASTETYVLSLESPHKIKSLKVMLISVTRYGEIAPYIKVVDFVRRYYMNYLRLDVAPRDLKIEILDGTNI